MQRLWKQMCELCKRRIRQNNGQLRGSKFTIGILLSVLPVNEYFVTGLLIAREHVTFVSPHLNPSPRGRGTLKSYSPSPNGIRGWGMRAVPPLAFLDRLPIALLGTFSSRGCIPIRAIVGGSNGYRRGVGNSVSPLLF